MSIIAPIIGLLIAAQGVLGLVAPGMLVALVSAMQVAPLIYFAAVIRVVFGLVLLRAAPMSRASLALRVLGILMLLGGLLTPFFGTQIAHVILGWWSAGGPMLVRVWAAAALAIGSFIVYAVGVRRSAA